MRLFGWFVTAVLLAGCAGTGDPDRVDPVPTSAVPTGAAPTTPPRPVGTPLGVPVTKTDVPYPSAEDVDAWLPPLGDGASAREQIEHHLRWEALLQSRAQAPTSARCDRLSLKPSAQSGCTVLYQGLPVPFTVVIDDEARPSGGGLFQYRSYQEKFVVRADVIRSEAWLRWGSEGEPTRCDRVPAVQVLPAGVTKIRCQHFADRVWETVLVEVTEDGAVLVV